MRRVVLSLLLMAVLLPSQAFARIAYLCGMDGKVRTSCCCPAKAQKRDAIPQTSIKGASCCEVSASVPEKAAATNPPTASVEVDAPFVAVLTLAPAALPRHRAAMFAPRAHAPPAPPDRSLFASQCALLL